MFKRLSTWILPKIGQISHYFLAQGAIQGLGFLFAILCLRSLDIPSYAEYSVVFSVLGSLSVLTDVGFSNTLASLVGERVSDVSVIAGYVRAIRRLRRGLYFFVAPLSFIIFPYLVRKQHWPWPTLIVMVLALVSSLWLNSVASTYGAVLILRRKRQQYYSIQIAATVAKLLLFFLLAPLHLLTGLTAIWINVVASLLQAGWVYRTARKELGYYRCEDNPELRQHIKRLALPNLPSILFYAVQGQITVFIITYWGHTTAIASVGALARLGQLFLLVSQMNPVLVEPYFARLKEKSLPKAYIFVVVTAALGVVAMVCATAIWPSVPLLLLGPKYSGLKREVAWMVASAGISYVSGMLWTIHFARRFVFWWNSWLIIAGTITLQILFAMTTDLSIVRNVLILGMATAASGLTVQVITGIAGFIKGPRRLTAVPKNPQAEARTAA